MQEPWKLEAKHCLVFFCTLKSNLSFSDPEHVTESGGILTSDFPHPFVGQNSPCMIRNCGIPPFRFSCIVVVMLIFFFLIDYSTKLKFFQAKQVGGSRVWMKGGGDVLLFNK